MEQEQEKEEKLLKAQKTLSKFILIPYALIGALTSRPSESIKLTIS